MIARSTDLLSIEDKGRIFFVHRRSPGSPPSESSLAQAPYHTIASIRSYFSSFGKWIGKGKEGALGEEVGKESERAGGSRERSKAGLCSGVRYGKIS